MNISFTASPRTVNLGLNKEDVPMGLVESKYLDRMDALTPKERVARAASMFQWAREAIARQILSDQEPMNPERLKMDGCDAPVWSG
jgi:hypothetical protein